MKNAEAIDRALRQHFGAYPAKCEVVRVPRQAVRYDLPDGGVMLGPTLGKPPSSKFVALINASNELVAAYLFEDAIISDTDADTRQWLRETLARRAARRKRKTMRQ
jgi:hypothetical protein